MKTKTLLALFFWIPILLNGQFLRIFTDYGSFSRVKHYYEHKCRINKCNCEIITGDNRMTVNVPGYDAYRIVFLFDRVTDQCVSQEIHFSCNICIKNHIEDILNMRMYGWKKSSGNTYLSNYFSKTEMQIIRDQISDSCLVIKFKRKSIPKAEYLKEYDLRKSADNPR